MKARALSFYNQLSPLLKPSCLKLAVQVTPRFCPAGNRFGTPESEEFNWRRQTINNYINRNLKRQGLVDGVILLGSVGFINDPSNYNSAGVHLSHEGLHKYKEAVMGGLVYALERSK